MAVVNGVSKRVIVVDSPDQRIFEQAIFIVRSDVLCDNTVSSHQLVSEARRIARSYARAHSCGRRPLRKIPALAWVTLASLAAGAVWMVVTLL